jgi:predicted RNA-binding Zn-ribbon protein involved in translation (DUF1610 family)
MIQKPTSSDHVRRPLQSEQHPCPSCHVQTRRPMLVTSQVVYYRCSDCETVWSIDRLMAPPRAI